MTSLFTSEMPDKKSPSSLGPQLEGVGCGSYGPASTSCISAYLINHYDYIGSISEGCAVNCAVCALRHLFVKRVIFE